MKLFVTQISCRDYRKCYWFNAHKLCLSRIEEKILALMSVVSNDLVDSGVFLCLKMSEKNFGY